VTTKTRHEFFDRAAGIWWLCFGMLAGPLAVLLNLQLSFMLVPWACATGRQYLLHLVPLGALLLVASAGVSAWRNWRRAGPGESDSVDGVMPRSRFMARTGLLTSGLFLLVLVALWLPNVMLMPCQR
jgi:hypothetical protein